MIAFGRPPSRAAIQSLDQSAKQHQILREIVLSPEFSVPAMARMRRAEKLSDKEIVYIRKNLTLADPVDLDMTKEDFVQQLLSTWLVEELRREGLTYVQMKSLPRSGHHFLVTLLERYFQDEVRYCRTYAPAECCHRIPCLIPYNAHHSNKYMLQKSHDFDLTDSKASSFKYIIQHRAIVTRVESNFELAIKEPSSGYQDTREDFARLCFEEAKQTIGFYNKWLAKDSLDKCVVAYEDLASNTAKTLDRVTRFVNNQEASSERGVDAGRDGVSVPKDHRRRLAHALKAGGTKVNTVNSPEGVRAPTDHRYYDKILFTEIEQWVRASCPTVEVRYYFV